MLTVGIRELKQQASELVRRVREKGDKVQVTFHGKVVALLIPVESIEKKANTRAWDDLDQLASEIAARWPDGISAVEAIAENRR